VPPNRLLPTTASSRRRCLTSDLRIRLLPTRTVAM
jgi:hypothetical protein